MDWNQGTAADIADAKRLHVATEETFYSFILSKMRSGPLRHLAEAMYRVLFLHPGCYGTALIANERLERVADIEIRDALSRIPAINGMHDPLVLRHAFLAAIIANLLEVLARHRDAALAALAAGAANEDSAMATLPSAGPSMKHYRDEVPVAGPSKRPRY